MTRLFEDSWRAGMQDVSAAIGDTMGELVRVVPAHAPKTNFPTIAEPQNAVTVTAVFSSRAKDVILSSERQVGNTAIAPIVSTREPIFTFG